MVTTTRYTEICRRSLVKRHRIVGMTRPVIWTVSQGTGSTNTQIFIVIVRPVTDVPATVQLLIVVVSMPSAVDTTVQLLIVAVIASYALLVKTVQKFIVVVSAATAVATTLQKFMMMMMMREGANMSF